MQNKAIEVLIDENYVYAKILDYFGVDFHKYANKTLEDVCIEHHMDLDELISNLQDSPTKKEKYSVDLSDFPAFLIVEYLKHTHQIFVKDTLPYLQKLVDSLDDKKAPEIVSDLKMVMPMFIEEFIHHIYEEEDKLFAYISELDNFVNARSYSSNRINEFEAFSIEKFAEEHHDSDDEMAGIRGLTFNYSEDEVDDVSFKVLMRELNSFDGELQRHAKIENEILIPKALKLLDRANVLLNNTVSSS